MSEVKATYSVDDDKVTVSFDDGRQVVLPDRRSVGAGALPACPDDCAFPLLDAVQYLHEVTWGTGEAPSDEHFRAILTWVEGRVGPFWRGSTITQLPYESLVRLLARQAVADAQAMLVTLDATPTTPELAP